MRIATYRPGTMITYASPVKKPVSAVNVGWSRCHQSGWRAGLVSSSVWSMVIGSILADRT